MAADDRLQRLLGGEVLAPLRLRLRQRFERAAAGAQVPCFRIERLTPPEHAALAALQGRSARFTASVPVDVALIDATLREAGVADSLRTALEQLDGRIVDRAAERAVVHSQWREVVAGCTHPALASLLQTASGLGLLKRLAGQSHAQAARALAGAQAVLQQLPAAGVTRAQLAAKVLGDAHALDTGCMIATLVLAVLRFMLSDKAMIDPQGNAGPPQVPLIPAGSGHNEPSAGERFEDADAEGLSARDLWASAGVLVNELARPVLVLNLPGLATPGEPTYLSLRRLLRSRPHWAVQDCAVFVCENPNLLAIAADHLGAACAPLVCTDGMPAAAQRSVLTQLAEAGAALHYHGDFDWPGLRIGNHVMREHGAKPWRFGAADYLAALGIAAQPGRLLQGATVEASWDAALAAVMRRAAQAIDEEMVADALLQDLALQSG